MVAWNLLDPAHFPQNSIRLGATVPKKLMSLYQRWMNLPIKARYYIGGSTFVFALLGDYITLRVNDEVQAREKVMKELEMEPKK